MCCAIAVSMLQLPQLLSVPEQLDRTPAQCIRTGDWLRAGLEVPPFNVMSLGWRGALRYIRQLDGSSPQLPLPPDVHDLPYEQRKNAILYSSTVPSVIELVPPSQQGVVPMSRIELFRLVEQLNKHSSHVTHLNLSNNSLEAVKFRLQAPFTRLTALKHLVLSCKPRHFFIMLL